MEGLVYLLLIVELACELTKDLLVFINNKRFGILLESDFSLKRFDRFDIFLFSLFIFIKQVWRIVNILHLNITLVRFVCSLIFFEFFFLVIKIVKILLCPVWEDHAVIFHHTQSVSVKNNFWSWSDQFNRRLFFILKNVADFGILDHHLLGFLFTFLW